MRKICILLLLLTSYSVLQAQTFFEFKYNSGADNCRALLTYWDSQNCKIRLVNGNVANSQDAKYLCDFKKDGKTNTMLIKPSKRSDSKLPKFLVTWTKRDQSDLAGQVLVGESPFDPEIFGEVKIKDMDDDFIGQYYAEAETEYRQLHNASLMMIRQTPKSMTASSSAGAPTMHLVMAAATLDDEIKESVSTDVDLVETNFRKFARSMNINFSDTVLEGDNFSKQNLLSVIRNLEVGPNDIVVFSYSGHGFRFQDDEDPYPVAKMVYDAISSDDDYINTTDIANEIKGKNAKLSLVITDCCNTENGAYRSEVEAPEFFARGLDNFSVAKLKSLFLESAGFIRLTAAKPGQKAWGDRNGGYLTSYLINTIKNQVTPLATDGPSWEQILATTMDNVRQKTEMLASNNLNMGIDPQIVVRSFNITDPDGTEKTQEPDFELSSFSSNGGDISADGEAVSRDSKSGRGWLRTILIVSAVCVLAVFVVRKRKK